MDQKSRKKDYEQRIEPIENRLRGGVSDDKLPEIQEQLVDVAEEYQDDDSIGRGRCKIYELQAVIFLLQEKYDEALKFVDIAEQVDGSRYDSISNIRAQILTKQKEIRDEKARAQQDRSFIERYWVFILLQSAIGAFLGAMVGFYRGNVLLGLLIGSMVPGVLYASMELYHVISEKIGSQMDKGRLFPYIIIAVVCTVALCGYWAMTLGNATCVDYDSDSRVCNEYSDDSFIPTFTQRWDKFWGRFPTTLLITVLIAVIIHRSTHYKKK